MNHNLEYVASCLKALLEEQIVPQYVKMTEIVADLEAGKTPRHDLQKMVDVLYASGLAHPRSDEDQDKLDACERYLLWADRLLEEIGK